MSFNFIGWRKKSRTITYHQIGTYLSQKKLPEPLTRACVAFLEDRARENGESSVGPKTMQDIREGTWFFTEAQLEAFYQKAPLPMRRYVKHVLCEPDMPTLDEIIRPVKGYSVQAQHAYIFLSETALRAVYGMMYEPDHVWKVVRFYDEEPVTTFG